MAVAYTVRDRMLDRFIHALQGLSRPGMKLVSYLTLSGSGWMRWIDTSLESPGDICSWDEAEAVRGACMRCSLVPWQCWWDG